MPNILDSFTSLTNLSQSHPFFLSAIKERREDFREAKRVFSYLSKVYLTARHSFATDCILPFLESFEKLCSILSRSGVKMLDLAGSISDFDGMIRRRSCDPDFLDRLETIRFPAPPSNWLVGVTASALDFTSIARGDVVTKVGDFHPIEEMLAKEEGTVSTGQPFPVVSEVTIPPRIEER
jgi:hypothetical protein